MTHTLSQYGKYAKMISVASARQTTGHNRFISEINKTFEISPAAVSFIPIVPFIFDDVAVVSNPFYRSFQSNAFAFSQCKRLTNRLLTHVCLILNAEKTPILTSIDEKAFHKCSHSHARAICVLIMIPFALYLIDRRAGWIVNVALRNLLFRLDIFLINSYAY